MVYRKEIDGLRALAVLPVILFHAGFHAFGGGFVGVDVFFVISGYLITSILVADIESGRFSIAAFYERRARRILPALLLVLIVSVPVAWVLLAPQDMKGYAKSLVAVPLFASNALFWLEKGYFGPAAELKPLLHTWSLAVEEQFYLFFPLFLSIFWRFGRRAIVVILVAASLLSLGLGEWGSVAFPNAAFFMLPTRGWELAIGCLLALHRRAGEPRPVPLAAREALALAGLGLIVLAVLWFDESNPSPTLYTLVPTIGAALVIAFAEPGTLAGQLLGWRPLVSVGLVSYSAYLWHQPLFAFARHGSLGDADALDFALLSLLSLLLAYVSWRFVEIPFRTPGYVSRQRLIRLCGAGSLICVLAGLALLVTNGAESRFSPEQRDLLRRGDYQVSMKDFSLRECFIDYDQEVETLLDNGCHRAGTTKSRVVVFGDSEAAHLVYGARKVLDPQQFEVLQWTATSCRPIDFSDQTPRCQRVYREFVGRILPELGAEDVLVLGGNWGRTFEALGPDAFVDQMRRALAVLTRQRSHVVVVGNAPDFTAQPLDRIVSAQRVSGETTRAVYAPMIEFPGVGNHVAELAQEAGADYFDPALPVCEPGSPPRCRLFDGKVPLFTDSNHFSVEGSVLVFGHLADAVGLARVRQAPESKDPELTDPKR